MAPKQRIRTAGKYSLLPLFRGDEGLSQYCTTLDPPPAREQRVDTLAPMERQLLPRVLLALLAVLSLYAAIVSLHTNGSGGHRPKAFGAPSFGFAGYNDLSNVTQISARWRVPFLASTRQIGAASTWIAAESGRGAFIQLGTTENVVDLTKTLRVFWSDPVVHFEPQTLATVKAGDLISYSMTKSSAGWTLRFRDRTSSQSGHVTIHYGATTSFNDGEWIQEDPTTGDFDVHLPYPKMSLVTFSHLRLNEQVPQLNFKYATVLSSSNGVYLIPTSVRHNRFTFHHAKGATLQYLQDALPLATALYPFDNDAQDNVTPSRFIVQDLESNIRVFASDLKTQRWPKATRPDIAGFVTYLNGLDNLVHTWPVASAVPAPQYYAELLSLGKSVNHFSVDLAAQLGIPPPE
jgi:hypothetical protein